MLRIGLAPCSPFSVTGDLLREAAALARAKGARLHTHLAETIDEEQFCRERFGRAPVEYLEGLGWLGDDVWLAHGIHFDDPAIKTLAVRDALELATIGGARLLGWDDQIGSLQPGKHGDVAVWRVDGLAHADIADPVAALVLGLCPAAGAVDGWRPISGPAGPRGHCRRAQTTESAVREHRSLLARASTVTCKEGTAS